MRWSLIDLGAFRTLLGGRHLNHKGPRCRSSTPLPDYPIERAVRWGKLLRTQILVVLQPEERSPLAIYTGSRICKSADDEIPRNVTAPNEQCRTA